MNCRIENIVVQSAEADIKKALNEEGRNGISSQAKPIKFILTAALGSQMSQSGGGLARQGSTNWGRDERLH